MSSRVAAPRRGMSPSRLDSEMLLECKAAYLSIIDDIDDDIKSKDQFLAVLQQTGRNPTPRVTASHWKASTRSLSFAEFCDICRGIPVTSLDDLMKAFRRIDLNGDGYISVDELYKVMTTKGEKMTMSEVRGMIDDVDDNKDGRLDYREFCNMVMSTTDECKKMSRKVMERKERRKQKMATKKSEPSPRMGRKPDNKGDNKADSEESDDIGEERQREHNGKINGVEKEISKPVPASRRRDLTNGSPDDRVTKKITPRQRSGERSPKDATKKNKLSEPRNLKDWTHKTTKGCFFIEDDGTATSHWFSLKLRKDTNVWLTIQPITIGTADADEDHPIDTLLYVMRSSGDKSLVTFTEQRDNKGKYSARCDLSAGTYILAPFTSGCRFHPRKSEPKSESKLLKKDKDDKIILTRAFRKALEDIFDMSDLDGNGSLSREEFNLFNIRTSGEEVADEEWAVVEENIELKHGEISKGGFIKLNEMEAEDNEGDTEDSWITLNNMGFSKALIVDEACPYQIDLYTEDCKDPELRVTGLENMDPRLEKAVCQAVIDKGEGRKVKGAKDVYLHTYTSEHRAAIVIENKTHSSVEVSLDCSHSKNCVSHTKRLVSSVKVPARSSGVGHYFLPADDKHDWSVWCTETLLK